MTLDELELYLRRRARLIARAAVGRGELTRRACECGQSAQVQAHHEDYSQPLAVCWLCPACHRRRGWRHRLAIGPRPDTARLERLIGMVESVKRNRDTAQVREALQMLYSMRSAGLASLAPGARANPVEGRGKPDSGARARVTPVASADGGEGRFGFGRPRPAANKEWGDGYEEEFLSSKG